ncbi:exonuclease domain-containing protein [Paenibacillus sp. J5C_2022]|uniref:exonuclease domain-containing protein n=1 Tax=Paenibacillus sp. J5C2022 TaxID=2977129 RepID=UPI0021CEF234|nr:exonuclease domain-containing protein [Paenibacillus sp. J5C2022]MCU6707617.1 exonuclease domain-containing protein [Paenibacillus sp. J5C2022]
MKEYKGIGRMWHLYKLGGVTPAIASMLGSQKAQHMAYIRHANRHLRNPSMLDMPLAELEAAVFDLETTGFHPGSGDEIISFGAVLMRGEKAIEEGGSFYSLVNPGRAIPEHIQQLTGITDDMVKEAPPLVEVLRQFMAFVGKRLLIAHASGHDKKFLDAALWRTSRVNLNHRVLDTMMVAKWLEPGREDYGLDGLLSSNGIHLRRRHHALDDALMTGKLWEIYLKRMLERQVTTLGDLYAYLSQH